MTAPALAAVLQRVCAVLPTGPVKVGVEAAGHCHRPLLGSGVWPAGWEVLELSPAGVAEQRRVQGRRRVKTDVIDLEAITELVLAGHGVLVTARAAAVIELTGWAMQRGRRVLARTATKNRLLAQLDRCFPGLAMVLPDVLGTKVGRLVAAEFADPHRLAVLGVARFIRFAANRGLRVRRSAAERLVAAAREDLPSPDAHLGLRCWLIIGAAGLPGCPDLRRGGEAGSFATGYAVRAVDCGAGLGNGPGRQLRRRGR